MNYILLDLEWNNTYFKKKNGFFNEIVEFGAIKLDDNFNEIDRFSQIVKSSITQKLSGRFKALTGMTNEEMLTGIPFENALLNYKKWAGENTVTLTWSTSDIYVIYDNCKYFTESIENAAIGKYVDLQQYFQQELALAGIETGGNQISLSNAAVIAGINYSEENLHHAVNDSDIAADILKKYYNKERFEKCIKNTDDPEFFKRLFYKPYYINDIKSPFIDRALLKCVCPICEKNAKRTTNWKFKMPWFLAVFYCTECKNEFKMGISFKKFYNSTIVRKKIFPKKYLPNLKKK